MRHPAGFRGPWTSRKEAGKFRYYDADGKLYPIECKYSLTEGKCAQHLDALNAAWEATQRRRPAASSSPLSASAEDIEHAKTVRRGLVPVEESDIDVSGYDDEVYSDEPSAASGSAQGEYQPRGRRAVGKHLRDNIIHAQGRVARFPIKHQGLSRVELAEYERDLLPDVQMREPAASQLGLNYSDADVLRILSRADEQGNRLVSRLFVRMWERQTEDEQRARTARVHNKMGFNKGDAFLAGRIYAAMSEAQRQGRAPVPPEVHSMLVALLLSYRRQLKDIMNQGAHKSGFRVRTNPVRFQP